MTNSNQKKTALCNLSRSYSNRYDRKNCTTTYRNELLSSDVYPDSVLPQDNLETIFFVLRLLSRSPQQRLIKKTDNVSLLRCLKHL